MSVSPTRRALALLRANDPAEALAVLREAPDASPAGLALLAAGLVPEAEAVLEGEASRG